MSRGTAHGRLTTERKLWRKDHPHENPKPDNAAQSQSKQILSEQPNEYSRRVREQASRYPPPV